MSVRIRLKRMGSKRKPFYRIVATDSRRARDGRFIETLGYYNPMTEPADVKIKEDLLFKWLKRGALPTENTTSILRGVGLMKKWKLIQDGVPLEELDAKYSELKAAETPPMSEGERKQKIEAKTAQEKADKESEAQSETKSETKSETEAEAAPAPSEEAAAAEEGAETAPAAEEEKPKDVG